MPKFTTADIYRTAMSVLMVVTGGVILVRTLPFGVHAQALLMALGFIGLGAYRLSFVVAYVRRRPKVLTRGRMSASINVPALDDAAPDGGNALR
jgi:hypothetical protein